MSRWDGLTVAAAGALLIFVIGVVSLVMWRLEERHARHRRAVAPWFKAPPWEPVTQELPVVPRGWCPGCLRNAGHDADCARVGRLGLAARAIEIPREGQGEQI